MFKLIDKNRNKLPRSKDWTNRSYAQSKGLLSSFGISWKQIDPSVLNKVRQGIKYRCGKYADLLTKAMCGLVKMLSEHEYYIGHYTSASVLINMRTDHNTQC